MFTNSLLKGLNGKTGIGKKALRNVAKLALELERH
jgi:hypothetical protein